MRKTFVWALMALLCVAGSAFASPPPQLGDGNSGVFAFDAAQIQQQAIFTQLAQLATSTDAIIGDCNTTNTATTLNETHMLATATTSNHSANTMAANAIATTAGVPQNDSAMNASTLVIAYIRTNAGHPVAIQVPLKISMRGSVGNAPTMNSYAILRHDANNVRRSTYVRKV